MMNNRQTGFTLIELVMVIVIIGILAAVAVPKFVDLSAEARAAKVLGVGGSLASASIINYATFSASNGTKGVAITSCNDADLVTLIEGWDALWTVAGAPAIANGASAQCTVSNGTVAEDAIVTIIGAS